MGLQEKVVTTFYKESNKLEDRALEVVRLCTPGSWTNPFNYPADSDQDSSHLYLEDKDAEPGYRTNQSLPAATNFREEMLKVVLLNFPSVAPQLPKSLAKWRKENEKLKRAGEEKASPAADGEDNKSKDEVKLTDIEKTLLFFHSYFTRVHVAQEERLIQIRTQCQAKFHKLKWITRQRELIAREQSELKWIIGEMKRAINRLTKEGVPLGPGEVDEDLNGGGFTREKSLKEQLVPIRAHRATWSEASDVIFRLNFNRQEQFERTQELEGALKLRESLREFIETLRSADEEELVRKIRLVESISGYDTSRSELMKANSSRADYAGNDDIKE